MSISWINTTFGHIIATIIATQYFVSGLEYHLEKIIFGMIMAVISCSLNSYLLEFKDKKEFLETVKIDLQQADLQKILTNLPEGVLIFKRFRNPYIIYWNNEFQKLLKFLPGSWCSNDEDLEKLK